MHNNKITVLSTLLSHQEGNAQETGFLSKWQQDSPEDIELILLAQMLLGFLPLEL